MKIKMANKNYSITELCTAYGVPKNTFYRKTNTRKINRKSSEIISLLKKISIETKHSYGKRRMQKELQLYGIKIGIFKVASLMKLANIQAITPRKKHYYPKERVSKIISDNILNREFNQKTPNTHWVGDITYIRNHQGWSYLATVLDLATKEIVGWSLSQKPNAKLAKKALQNAIRRKQPDTSKLLFHSDRGVQYTSNLFVNYCENLHITKSVSRKGNCWDNAVMERFFRSLKSERLNYLSFKNHQEVTEEVDSYIYFYNYKRLNSAINYMTPNEKFNRMINVA